jgi:hypothetical protein
MSEQLGIVLLFLVVVLFNLISGVLSRRRKRDAEAEKKDVPQPAPRPVPRPRRPVATSPLSQVSSPAPPRVARRGRRPPLGRTELRRAIALMTVLGPPQALADERRDRPG